MISGLSVTILIQRFQHPWRFDMTPSELQSGSFTAVVAMTRGGVIGRDGDMPWRLKSDLKRFKKLTLGGWLVMGRRTYDSIGRPLPGRQTLVLTRNPDWSAPGVTTCHDATCLFRITHGTPAYVVGGAEIYRLLWDFCTRIYLTTVEAEITDGDTFLEVDWSPFEITDTTHIPAGDGDQYATTFSILQRIRSA